MRPRCMRGIRKVTFQLGCHLLGFHIRLVSYRLGSLSPLLASAGASQFRATVFPGWDWQCLRTFGRRSGGGVQLACNGGDQGCCPVLYRTPPPTESVQYQCEQLRNPVMTFDCIIFPRKAFLVVFLSG